ncbi:substrate-binding periplasmic protein [candidate division CSSED10-310 bacterium]|uniref:Substrate-binding periplasmic protein n=1 Tax=candidate division CSSED10-310 bacterium TaxID=2855610 RepID=A0ABV6YXQ3_UNCC1
MDVSLRYEVLKQLIYASLIMSLIFSSGVKAQELKIYTEDSIPLNYINEKGVLTGSVVEIVQEIQSRIDSRDPILVMPWKRAYQETIREPNVVLFSMTFTEQRRDLFNWVGPVAQISWVFYARADSKIVLKSLDEAKNVKRIGTYLGDVREQFLKAKGFTNLENTNSSVQNLHKLLLGRITLWASSDLGARELIKEEGIDVKSVKPAFSFKSFGLYIAFSKKTSNTIIEKWQKAYTEIKSDGTLANICWKWGHTLPTHTISPPPDP